MITTMAGPQPMETGKAPGSGLPRRVALVSLATAVLCLAGLAGIAAWQAGRPPQPGNTFASLGHGVEDVRLTDSRAQPVRWGDLDGAPRAVFFGFTRCPEICPTTLAELDGAVRLIGPAAQRLQVQFVTVDPTRDTPALLGSYLDWFEGGARGFTGTEAEIARLAEAFRVRYRKVPLEGGDYTMDHTALVFLMDEHGAVRDAIVYGVGPERAAVQLRALLGLPAGEGG